MDCQDCTDFPDVDFKDLDQKCKYCVLYGPPILWTPMENKYESRKIYTTDKRYTIEVDGLSE